MVERIETEWTADIGDFLKKMEAVEKTTSRVADLQEAAAKANAFQEAARKAGNYNKSLLTGVKTYAQIQGAAKSYEAELKRLQGLYSSLMKQRKEYAAAGQYDKLKKDLLEIETRLRVINELKEKLDNSMQPQQGRSGRSTSGSGGGSDDDGTKKPSALKSITTSLTNNVTGLVGGLFALDQAWDLAVKGPAEFGRALSQLSAITGLTGKSLEFLAEQAVQIEIDTGKSATSILQAYQAVGSIRPELLENKQALSDVTKEVLALQDAAANISLEDAANALLGSLNQFEAGSEEASRFVNVLAAGAKLGSSEIRDTAEAFKVAGTASAAAGLSFEQSNAIVQSLAGVMIKGSEAGTALRNVIIKLETDTDKNLRPSVVGLDTALTNASKKFDTTSKLAKAFGAENIVAARRIIDTRGEISKLTKDLTGTETAYEQQRENLNNLATDLDKLGSSFKGFFRDLSLSQDGWLRYAVQSFTNFFNQLRDKSSDLRLLLSRVFEGTSIAEIQAQRQQRQSLENRKVQEAGIQKSAIQEITKAIDEQSARNQKAGLEKNKADLDAATMVLANQKKQLDDARKQYQDTVDKFRSATTNDERKRLQEDSKLDALLIKTAKVRVETAEKAVDATNKKIAAQSKARASALIDESNKAGKKEQKAHDKQQTELLQAQEKYQAELLKMEKEYGKERLESMVKDSTAYLQEKARLDTLEIEQEQQAFLKLKQLAGARKFDKQGNPLANEDIELSTGELELFGRRKQAVMDRLQLELKEFYKNEIDETQKHQDAINEVLGDEYDQQVEKVRQKYAEILKAVKRESAEEVRVVAARENEIRRIELTRQLDKLDRQQNVAQSDAELNVIKAQIAGRLDLEIKAQIRLLEIERNGLQNRMNVIAQYGDDMAKQELNNLGNRIEAITGQIEKLKLGPAATSIWDVFKLPGDVKEGIKQLQPILDTYQQFADLNLQFTQQRLDAIDREIDAKKRQIEEEKKLNEEGVASNLDLRKKEYAQLKEQRQKALQQQIQAQRLANAQETATQAASLITASANIIKFLTAKLGPIGLPIAAVAITAMGALFTASKIKVAQLARSQARDADTFREGGRLKGPSHERGGDAHRRHQSGG